MLTEQARNQYYTLRDEIIEASLLFSRKITVFAMLEELIDLQAMFCYSKQELSVATDNKLILISLQILNKMREFVEDMGEYGIDEGILTLFLDKVNHFQLASSELSRKQIVVPAS